MDFGCESCKKCKDWEEHYYWDHVDADRMHFYRVMINDFSRRLSVPKKFMNNFKGELSKVIDLKGPSGNIWQVGLTKGEHEVFFQSGWKDFVQAHHIEEDDLLVFKYDGNSCFEISMFDGSGCEKEAAYVVKSTGKPLKRQDLGSSINLSNDTPQGLSLSTSCTRNSREFQNAQAKGCSFTKKINRKKKSIEPRKNGGALPGRKYPIKQESVDKNNQEKLTHPNLFFSRTGLTGAAEKKALQLVHAVKLDNPCFLLVMTPTNVGKRSYLGIPAEFVAAHLPSKNQSICLRIPNQRKKWSVSYIVQKTVSGLCGKWKYFVAENNLEEGDVCLFELIKKSGDVVLIVHILHASDHVGSKKL